jgi:hypothetical protein
MRIAGWKLLNRPQNNLRQKWPVSTRDGPRASDDDATLTEQVALRLLERDFDD